MKERTEVRVNEGCTEDGRCSPWCDHYTDTLYAIDFCLTEDDPFCTLVEEETSPGGKCLAGKHSLKLVERERE